MDKAGNESVYIARGVIFAKLVPDLAITSNLYALENVEENTYQINVNQGDSVDDVISSLSLTADNNSQYITQVPYLFCILPILCTVLSSSPVPCL